MFKNQNDKMI